MIERNINNDYKLWLCNELNKEYMEKNCIKFFRINPINDFVFAINSKRC